MAESKEDYEQGCFFYECGREKASQCKDGPKSSSADILWSNLPSGSKSKNTLVAKREEEGSGDRLQRNHEKDYVRLSDAIIL